MHAVAYLPPTTPSRPEFSSPTHHTYSPVLSSPLASSPASSPTADAHSHRRAQYKANPFSTPPRDRSRPSHAYGSRRTTFVQGSSAGTAQPQPSTEEPPRKAFLKERLKARAIERAVQKRERAKARGSRHMSSEPSSDGVDEMMDEDDEDEESMLNDEVRVASLPPRLSCFVQEVAHVNTDAVLPPDSG